MTISCGQQPEKKDTMKVTSRCLHTQIELTCNSEGGKKVRARDYVEEEEKTVFHQFEQCRNSLSYSASNQILLTSRPQP